MGRQPIRYQLSWLTSTPLLRGNWLAMALALLPISLALIALLLSSGLERPEQGPMLLSAALFLSLGAALIQLPAFMGRAELDDQSLIVTGRLGGRLMISRQALGQVAFSPLRRPPAWLSFGWAMLELVLAAGAFSAGRAGTGDHWYWLSGLAAGLSFWPLMVARWQAGLQVIIEYPRGDDKRPGLIRAWATPQQANSLVNTLKGLIDWQDLEEEE